MKLSILKLALLVVVTSSLGVTDKVHGADWPHWRGPDYNGISSESDWKTDFGRTGPPTLWKAKIGNGYSSCVVSDGKLYILGLQGSQEVLSCLDAVTGDKIWSHKHKTTFKPQFYDGGTSGTPTVVDGKVYLLGQTGEVICLDAKSGDKIWETNIKSKLDLEVGIWGFTGAPFSYNDIIILNAGKNGVALDKKSGKVVWSSGTDANGYATPVPFKQDGEQVIALFGSKALYAVYPDSGKVKWSYPWSTQYDVNAADPVFLDESRILISSGYGTGAALIQLIDSTPKQIWKNKNLKTQFNAAVLHANHFYGIDGNTSDKATLNCIHATTGKLVWKQDNIGSGGLILSNNHLILISERGQLLIAPASSDGFKPIVRKQIYGGKTWTVPTLANGILYTRNSRGDLVAIDLR